MGNSRRNSNETKSVIDSDLDIILASYCFCTWTSYKCCVWSLVAVQAYLTQAKEEFHQKWEAPAKSVSSCVTGVL